MKIRKVVRPLAIISLISLVPVFGLTNGPVQPEFMSFEPVDATDMVNLPTGDFSYVLPLGEVKGPAGVGYPIVLSYHSGIMNDQEATWVGLGWSLNVGSINRMVRGFPDDYSGENTIVRMYDRGERGWDYNIGFGYGPISASVGWTEKAGKGVTWFGLTSIGLSGIMLNTRTGGIGIDGGYGIRLGNIPVQMNIGLTVNLGGSSPGLSGSLSLGNPIVSFTLRSNGGVGFSSLGFRAETDGASSMSEKGINQWANGWGIVIPTPWITLSYSYTAWGWSFQQMNQQGAWGYLYQSPEKLTLAVESNNDVLTNAMNVGKFWTYQSKRDPNPGNVSFKANNLYTVISGAKLEYQESGEFNLPSQDIYQFNGQGLSGEFKPYSYNSMSSFYSDLPEEDGIIGKRKADNTFDYYYNDRDMTFKPEFNGGLIFKVLGESALNLVDNVDDDNVGSDYTYPSGYSAYENIDATGNAVNGTRVEPVFGMNPAFKDKLSGFVITDQQGKTYYYTKPLFQLQQVSYNNMEPEVPDFKNKNGIYSQRADLGAYATTWLLTAITGPDYVKRNLQIDDDEVSQDFLQKDGEEDVIDLAQSRSFILPHEGDWGYWAKFRYAYGAPISDKDGSNSNRMPKVQPEDYTNYSNNVTYAPFQG
jgi:hypothetical protein